MVEKKFYDEAIAYINNNKTWSQEEEQIAMNEMAGGFPLRPDGRGTCRARSGCSNACA